MSRENAYKTILTLSAAAMIARFVFEIDWLAYVSLGLMVAALMSGWLAEKISWLWLKFGEFLGKINSKLIMGALFFIFLSPIALLYRLFGKNSMQPKRKAEGESYFIERNHKYEAKDLKNLW